MSAKTARFLKFALVGASNTAITLAVFHLLAETLAVPALWANAVGWLAGFVNSFTWNRVWTFRDARSVPTRRVLPRFAASTLVALAVSSGVVLILQALVPVAGRGAPALDAIEAVAILTALVTNYTLSTRWAFRVAERPDVAGTQLAPSARPNSRPDAHPLQSIRGKSAENGRPLTDAQQRRAV